MDQNQIQFNRSPASKPQGEPVGEGEPKGKRRSKHEQEGRNYKCHHCDKTYLSYPALYIHNKNKHKNTNEPITENGRGRGRPKKV